MRVGNEPVRLPAWTAGAVVAVATFLLAWSEGVDWRVAAGAALLELLGVGGAGELGRARAYGPDSHEAEVVDAATHARMEAVEADNPEAVPA